MQAADNLSWKLTQSEIFSDDKDLCFRIVGLIVVESSELRCSRGVKLRALLGNNTKVCVECCRLSAVFRSTSNDTGRRLTGLPMLEFEYANVLSSGQNKCAVLLSTS